MGTKRETETATRLESTCEQCGRTPQRDENVLDDWRVYSTGVDLLLFCPECAERESGKS